MRSVSYTWINSCYFLCIIDCEPKFHNRTTDFAAHWPTFVFTSGKSIVGSVCRISSSRRLGSSIVPYSCVLWLLSCENSGTIRDLSIFAKRCPGLRNREVSSYHFTRWETRMESDRLLRQTFHLTTSGYLFGPFLLGPRHQTEVVSDELKI